MTEADLPPASGELAGKPTHRHVTAMRQLCQDLLLKCEEEKKGANGTTINGTVAAAAAVDDNRQHPESEEKVDDKRASISAASSTTVGGWRIIYSAHSSSAPSFTPSVASPTGADEDRQWWVQQWRRR